jgi:hypothetical protein
MDFNNFTYNSYNLMIKQKNYISLERHPRVGGDPEILLVTGSKSVFMPCFQGYLFPACAGMTKKVAEFYK